MSAPVNIVYCPQESRCFSCFGDTVHASHPYINTDSMVALKGRIFNLLSNAAAFLVLILSLCSSSRPLTFEISDFLKTCVVVCLDVGSMDLVERRIYVFGFSSVEAADHLGYMCSFSV